MESPPVSMIKQLLDHAGIVVSTEPLVTTKSSKPDFPLWDNLIKKLVPQE